MALIRIPKKYHDGIHKFLGLSEEEAGKLLATAQKATATLSPSRLSRQLASILPAERRGDATKAIGAIFTLYGARAFFEMSVDVFVSNLIEFMMESGVFPEVNSDTVEPLRERLTNFLKLEDTLGVTSKARHLMTDHERIFCNSRLVTDIRPVFGDNPENPPADVVIVHTLNIHYHENNIHKEFYVALDDEDLADLREVVIRAEKKSETLKSLLRTKSLNPLED